MDIKDVLSSPILGLVVAVLGVVIGYVLYLKGKRDKEPHWAVQTVNLIKDYSGTVAGLEIQYLGEKVRDLSVSKLAFWNYGALTINSEDLVRADPLRIEARGNVRILSTKLISLNSPASQPLLSGSPEKKNVAFLNFEYLDRGHGFVIQVIHEGTSSYDLELKGVIKGAPQVRKIDLSNFINKSKKERIKDQVVGFLVLIVLFSLISASWVLMWPAWREKDYLLLFIYVLGGVGLPPAAIAGLIAMVTQVTRQVPTGLESFYTDPRQPET